MSRRKNYIEQSNPLRWLSPQRVVALLEDYNVGRWAEVMWAFASIEEADPDMVGLIARYIAPITAMDWDIREVDGVVDAARVQKAALRQAYERIGNWRQALEHLALAKFRGIAVLQCQDAEGRPAAPGEAVILRPINPWNLVRDGRDGALKWNPDARVTFFDGLPESELLDPERDYLIIRECRRPIDRIALVKWIRSNYSQKAWADFVETAARQGVAVIEPVGVSEDARALYRDAAEAFAEGSSVSLPGGAQVVFANQQRGAPPFEAHMRFLREQLVLAGTGGMLTMLAEPTGIGQGATGAHEAVFQSIAAADAAEISETLQIYFDRRVLRLEDAAVRTAIYFQLAARENVSATSLLDDAVRAKQAGLLVDAQEISEKTGYKLVADTTATQSAFPFSARGFASNKRAATPKAADAKAQLDALTSAATARIDAARREAFKPVADRLQQLYADAAPDSGVAEDEIMRRTAQFIERDLPELFKQIAASPVEQLAWMDVLGTAMVAGISAKDAT